MELSTIAADQAVPQFGTAQTDRYRLMLFNGAGTHVLLQQDRDQYFLPEIRIPRFTRPAEQITSVLRDIWRIPAVLLWSSRLESDQQGSYYGIMEACKGAWEVPSTLDWFPIHTAASYLDGSEGVLLKSSHANAVQPHFGVDPAPFSRLGWIGKLEDWVQTILRSRGIELRDFSQLNGSETFSLVRFETSKKPLWFKAVGKPNLREFPITLLLSELFPGYLPPILASDPVVNGWLMESSGDATLRDVEGPNAWQDAIRRLADLQIESIERTGRLLDAGARDLRIETLAGMTDAFFSSVASLMQNQTKTSPAPLMPEELWDLASTIKEALRSLAALGMPDTLGHGDFNPGNILVDGRRCVFTDWAEAHVGHPFLTFEYFLAYLRKSSFPRAIQEEHLREAYSQCWLYTDFIRSIEPALQLSPLIAVYAYAISGDAWRDPERLAIPWVSASLRSLTRRMKQEAGSLRHSRNACNSSS